MQLDITVYTGGNVNPAHKHRRVIKVTAIATLEGDETGESVETMLVNDLNDALKNLKIGSHNFCEQKVTIRHSITPPELAEEMEIDEHACGLEGY